MKSALKKVLTMFLAFLFVVSMVPFSNAYADNNSNYGPVDIFYEKDGTSSYYTVQLGASKNLNGCKNCVNRMRDLGYNAFLYRANSEYYRLCVGVFDSTSSAKTLAATIRSLAPIKGTKAESAYSTSIKLDYDAADTYCNYYYGSYDSDYDSGVDNSGVSIYYESDPNCDLSVSVVQVGASKDLSACIKGVERMRENGYNAYVYQKKGSAMYRVVIGAFARDSYAKDLATEIRNNGKVKGLKTESAYVTHIVINLDAFDEYCDYYW